ncbi:hypothetical protein B0H13DRAFT_1885840 [Mycena leptocephala]|nr:hypothetical protein B0H13DRAFT_1885840 [Mycena leptocephala]
MPIRPQNLGERTGHVDDVERQGGQLREGPTDGGLNRGKIVIKTASWEGQLHAFPLLRILGDYGEEPGWYLPATQGTTQGRDGSRSQKHAQMVKSFLGGQGKYTPSHILTCWMTSPDALTSFALQTVGNLLARGAEKAVQASGGLQISLTSENPAKKRVGSGLDKPPFIFWNGLRYGNLELAKVLLRLLVNIGRPEGYSSLHLSLNYCSDTIGPHIACEAFLDVPPGNTVVRARLFNTALNQSPWRSAFTLSPQFPGRLPVASYGGWGMPPLGGIASGVVQGFRVSEACSTSAAISVYVSGPTPSFTSSFPSCPSPASPCIDVTLLENIDLLNLIRLHS